MSVRSTFGRKNDCIQTAFTVLSTNPISGTLANCGNFALSGNYFYSTSGTVGNTAYKSFCAELGTALTAIDSGSATWTVGFNPQYGKIELFNNSGSRSIIWKTGITEQIIGAKGGVTHTALNTTGSVYLITGSYVPYYVWRSQYSCRTNLKQPYEPVGFYSEGVADDGRTFSIGFSGSLLCSDWRFEYEPESKVRIANANPLEPWTWEHLVKYARANIPWTVHTSSLLTCSWVNKEAIYRFRAEESNFKPEVKDPTYQYHQFLSVKTKIAGTGSFNGLY